MTPKLLEFEILWYYGGQEHAPNRVVGRTRIKRYNLNAAITRACNLLKKPGKNDGAAMARGFYVRLVNYSDRQLELAQRNINR